MEIIVIHHGQLLVNVGGEDFVLSEGQVLLVNPRQLHLMRTEDQTVCYDTLLFPVELISFQSLDLLEQTVFQPLRTGRATLPNLVPDELLNAGNRSLLEKVVRVNVEKEYLYQLETRLLLLRFFMALLRSTGLEERSEDNAGQMQRQLLEYIRIHYRDSLTLSDLAEQFHLSSKYLSRYFKEKFHITISEYIRHLRMTHAKELLETTDLSITEVAAQSGFSGVSFFIRQFTEANGCSPRKWKQARKKREEPDQSR
jgi:AraC-like DNA-binding protein